MDLVSAFDVGSPYSYGWCLPVVRVTAQVFAQGCSSLQGLHERYTAFMPDRFSKETRSRIMSKIGGKNTSPEMLVRRYLHRAGLRFRLHERDLPGRPDLVLRKYGTVVFVHGCFWHQHRNCRFARMPSSNRPFWLAKLSGNQTRDKRQARALRAAGWKVITVWECEITERRLERLVTQIAG